MHVGVILVVTVEADSFTGIPHACGGEPEDDMRALERIVFPTHVGESSRKTATKAVFWLRQTIPHARGGKPAKSYLITPRSARRRKSKPA